MGWLLAIGLTILFAWLYFKFFKLFRIKSIVFIDGGLGTGKSFLSVSIAIRQYKKRLRQYKLRKFVLRALSFVPRFADCYKELEEPLLFSNIPLRGVKHCPLTIDLLTRKTRFPYKSVVLIDELSIIVDQFDYKDRELSDNLRDFFKLFRHETKNGLCVINSQSTADLHYSIKSVLSDYLYIHHKTKLPFVSVLKVREMQYSADKDANHIVNNESEDADANLRTMLVFNRYFKVYDSYCYSILSDGLPVEQNYLILDKSDSLKTETILTFKKERYKKK